MVSTVTPLERTLRVPARGGVLVFDGYCGFCTRSVHAVRRLDRRDRVRPLPLQGPRVLEVTGISRPDALRAAWWIGADGSRSSGAGAINDALAAATGVPLFRWLYRVPGIRRLQDRAYRWVAEHRHLLRGVTPYCVAHPEAGCAPDHGASCGLG